MLFVFNFVSQEILNALFIFHFVKLIASNSDNESSSKSIYFSGDPLCFNYFDVIILQRLKKKLAQTFSPVQELILDMLRDLILQLRDFHLLN